MTKLTEYFVGASAKLLTKVEITPDKSNQHEFNGLTKMTCYLGSEKKAFDVTYLYIGQEENDRAFCKGSATWYQARKPPRREFRFYYRNNEVIDRATVDDTLITALKTDGTLIALIIKSNSPYLDELLWLFGLDDPYGSHNAVYSQPSDFAEVDSNIFSFIVEQADISIDLSDSDEWLDLLLDRFGNSFPKTRDFSALANETLVGEINPVEAPDHALTSLIIREEALFKQLEKHIINSHLKEHSNSWIDDHEEFLKFSLSVHNRRKSRAGHSFENHIEWILKANFLCFERGVNTENRSKPDFLFPGKTSYRDTQYPDRKLAMLGAKTTCKDRWRQILKEAARIPEKHLITLQPNISSNQLEEMKAAKLSLVLPKEIQKKYTKEQLKDTFTLEDFIFKIKSIQI